MVYGRMNEMFKGHKKNKKTEADLMRRMTSILILLIALTVLLVACSGEEATVPTEPDTHQNETVSDSNDTAKEKEKQVKEDTLITERKTVQLETGIVSALLPKDWEITSSGGFTTNDDNNRGVELQIYNVELVPPQTEKAMALITIWKYGDGQPLLPEEFVELYTNSASALLPMAVEDTVEFIEVKIPGGNAVYTILTDAELLEKPSLAPDEFLYVAMFYASYDSGYFSNMTLFTDDIESESFKVMLNAAASIEPDFELAFDEIELHTLKVWEEIKGDTIFDLEDINMLNLDLRDSVHLSEYMLESEYVGETLNIAIITDGEEFIPINPEPDGFIWNAGGIGMMYNVIPDSSMRQSLDSSVIRDLMWLVGGELRISSDLPPRMSTDEKTAVFAIRADYYDENEVIYVYILQEIQNTSHTLLLKLILFYDIWDDDSLAELAELGEYIGTDLTTYYKWW